jgi:AraC family transcriptional regulator of adaptative response / DNA-3-methyladenine glycosylase II
MNAATEFTSLNSWHQIATALRGDVVNLSAAKLARKLGLDANSLDTLMLLHRHKPAAREVAELRVQATINSLVHGRAGAEKACADHGFASTDASNRALLGYCGMDAHNLKALDGCTHFQLRLPAHYRVAETLAYLSRDPRSNNVHRQSATCVVMALVINGTAVCTILRFGEREVDIELDTRLDSTNIVSCLAVFRRVLGFAAPTAALLQRARREPEVQRLMAGRRGLRVHQTARAWDALVWAVLGQQISLSAAYTLLRRLSDAAGTCVAERLRTLPRADIVAQMSDADLRACKLSRAKARTLHLLATKISAGELDLAALEHGSAVSAHELLLAQNGIGPWTANYVMMRGFGFADCAPIGDAGLRRALRQFLDLPAPPSDKDMAQLMAPFAPHRSLATFHLWRGFDGALPTT